MTELDGRDLILELITTLSCQKSALNLPSRIPNTSCLSENLARIGTQVKSEGFNVQWTVLLCQVVVDKSSDIILWKAVFDLVAQTLATSPQIIPTSSENTIVTRSSALWQGSEQTRAYVDARIFEEILSCTHQNVAGFFEKYFDKPDRAAQVDKIFQATMAQYSNGRWADFPNPPSQAPVLNWFFQFQSRFLPNQRGVYCTSHNQSLAGLEAKRQLDLLVMRRYLEASALAPTAKLDWKDVWVLGELKEGQHHFKALLVQLATYAREVFASQPSRLFVHGFTLQFTKMQLWIFDRSGPYSSTEFDIHEQPKKFVQAIAIYLMMTDLELGFDPLVEHHGNDQFITVSESQGGAKKRFQLHPDLIAVQQAIVCRGTTCYRAKLVGSKSWDYVVKLSWRSSKRPAEAELLKLAQQRDVQGVAKIFAHNDIISIAELRSGLRFGKPHSFRNDPRSTSSIPSKTKSLLARSFNRLHSRRLIQSDFSPNQNVRDDERDGLKRPNSLNVLAATPRSLQKRRGGRGGRSRLIKTWS